METPEQKEKNKGVKRHQNALKAVLSEKFGEEAIAKEEIKVKPLRPDQRRKGVPYSHPLEKRLESKKKRFLTKIKERVDSTLKTAGFEYPDILRISREVNVTLDHLASWLKSDKDFADRLAQIELIALQEARRQVFNATKKNPYLALQLLSKRAPEFKETQTHKGTFTHIHVVSNVRSKSIPEPVNAVFQELSSDTNLIALDSNNRAGITENTTQDLQVNITDSPREKQSTRENETESERESEGQRGIAHLAPYLALDERSGLDPCPA